MLEPFALIYFCYKNKQISINSDYTEKLSPHPQVRDAFGL